jgi:hypothetical protein
MRFKQSGIDIPDGQADVGSGLGRRRGVARGLVELAVGGAGCALAEGRSAAVAALARRIAIGLAIRPTVNATASSATRRGWFVQYRDQRCLTAARMIIAARRA